MLRTSAPDNALEWPKAPQAPAVPAAHSLLATTLLERALRRPLRFTLDDAQRAGDSWRFNCGPAALCAVLDLTPDEIRPKMGDFESKGYTNPTLMKEVLARCGATQFQVYRSDKPGCGMPPPVPLDLGLVRVQWAGPWTKEGVPMRVRYRHTHWVGVRNNSSEIFDINAMCCGGWLPRDQWSSLLVPWLIRECVPKGNGNWWPTHALAVALAGSAKCANKACRSYLPRGEACRYGYDITQECECRNEQTDRPHSPGTLASPITTESPRSVAPK